MPNLDKITDNQLTRAAVVIRQGGVVAFPTETYYGLAVDPFNQEALERLFWIKERPAAKPILTLISAVSQLESLVADIPTVFTPLMANYWPGPLTLVFPAKAELPALLTAGTSTIGVRISSHPIAQALAKLCPPAITATSANISGMPPALNMADLKKQFGSKLDLIIDAETLPGGAASTLVGCDRQGLVILRHGAVTI